jgi:hypothetical protein
LCHETMFVKWARFAQREPTVNTAIVTGWSRTISRLNDFE